MTPDNLILLCPFHHRLVHEGGFTIATEPDGKYTFLHRGGWEIETAPLAVATSPIAELKQGLDIGPQTITSPWKGERCDYGVGVEVLLRRDAIGGSTEPVEEVAV